MYQVVGYHRPTTVPDALQLLASADRVAVAGGVHVRHDGGAAPVELVDLQAVGLGGVDVNADTASIGATVTLQDVVDDERLPTVIREAARAEQPSALRSLATIGGTVAASSGDSLLVAALLAHDALVDLATSAGERSVSLAEAADLPDGELIVGVRFQTTGQAAIERTGRTPRDTPIVGVVGRRIDGGATTIAVAGVGPTAVRLGPDGVAALQPIEDHRATSAYRHHLAEVLTDRVLARLA